jgi:hypothetical protein
MGGASPAASHDEFQVNCYDLTANRIVDLGKVDYKQVTIPGDRKSTQFRKGPGFTPFFRRKLARLVLLVK